mgnify:CR=1 FL=1
MEMFLVVIVSIVALFTLAKEKAGRLRAEKELKTPVRLPVLINAGRGDIYSGWVYVDRFGTVFAPENEKERVLELADYTKDSKLNFYRSQLGAAHWTFIDHPTEFQVVMLGRVYTTKRS